MPAMELKDFTDSTDWIPTSLPAFSPLETALRCEVCKEFYNNPVITLCAHTFCSLCIRRCIAVDGKCPSCKKMCQADKLVINIALREVVAKWLDARKDALDLARRDTESSSDGGKKRKIDDTDLEEEQEQVRHTRARRTRNGQSRGSQKTYEEAIVVEDSEEENDEEFLPKGFAKCPMCNDSMKIELVYDHVAICTGKTTGRTTRSGKAKAFPIALQSLPREATSSATRLSGLNYAMLTETALKKKLKELGIPNNGSKPVLIKRHQEWLNIFNSNCDAADNVRKTKRELLRELDEWERTQGGHANTKESYIMRKDFDGASHATTHKNQFEDLIAQARAKAQQRRKLDTSDNLGPTPQDISFDTPHHEQQRNSTDYRSDQRDQGQSQIDQSQPYEDNEDALSSIRRKVEEPNTVHATDPPLDQEANKTTQELSIHTTQSPPESNGLSFAGSSRQVPMFALPAEPVVDVERSNNV